MKTTPQEAYRLFIESLGLSSGDNPEIREAPERVTDFFEEFLAVGAEENRPQPSVFPCEPGSGVVAVTNLPYHSLCAHHFLPFFGVIHVLYEPSSHIIGFSGVADGVEHLSHRPTLQEYLTEQICASMCEIVHPAGQLVVVEARQLCMEMRGVHKSGVIRTIRSEGSLEALEQNGGWRAYTDA